MANTPPSPPQCLDNSIIINDLDEEKNGEKDAPGFFYDSDSFGGVIN